MDQNERVTITEKLVEAATDFDRARVDALRLQKERNDSEECTDPGEKADYQGGLRGVITDSCWKTKRKHDEEGFVVGPSGVWCDNCRARGFTRK